MPPGQEPSPTTLEDHLLDPINLKAARHLKAGGTISVPNAVALKLPWSPEQVQSIHNQLNSWLTSRGTNKLVEFLRREPTAIAHPFVFRQMFYLSQLLRQNDEDDLKELQARGGNYDDNQPVLPPGIKLPAKKFLSKLVSAWVSAILPGHEVKPVKLFRRRGRTAKWSTEDRIAILTEFGRLSEALHKIEDAGPAEIAPKKNEPITKFLKRMEAVVQDLNTPTLEYWAARIETPATMTKGAVLKKQRSLLPNTVTSKIVRQAVRDKRLSKNKLLYGILAHHNLKNCLEIETMRGLIEHAEADFPALDSRRRSHSSKS